MLKAQELARLQRAIDGISSPDSSEPSSPCDFFSELAQSEGPPPHEAPSENPSQDQDKAANGHVLPNTTETTEGTDKRKNETTAADPPHAAEEDEDFNIHLLLKQGRRQRMQRQHQQQSDSKEQPVALPPVEIALEEAAFRVRQRLAQKEEEAAARAARLAGDEVQHVSASGPGGGSRRPAKKQQQVYVGLPVGVGWHVPLVGVEGRGGYKPAEGEGDEDREKKASASGRGGQKRPLTVKEREKLKRKKGQSSHATWKPETWMQLRQQFD